MSLLGNGLQYTVETLREGRCVSRSVEHNIMPQQAIDHIAGLIRGAGPTPISTWYVGLFEGDYVPTPSVTAAELQTTLIESLSYTETTRPVWLNRYDNVGFIGNTGEPADFTMSAAKTIRGAFIVSSPNKGGTGGVLLSVARFATAKQVDAGTTLRVSAGLVLTPTSPL